jgi:ADP-heptose:LPS heptosyltransferase
MRILVLRGGALGDFIVTLPALAALRARWPAAVIELAGNPVAAELGQLSGCIDGIHSQSEARWSQFYREAPLDRELAEWLNGFDVILSFWPDPDGDLQRHLAARRPRVICASANITARPAGLHFAPALAELGVLLTDPVPRLRPSADLIHTATQRLGSHPPAVALHCGSGSARKNWPLERWQALLAAVGEPVLCIRGEPERSLQLRLPPESIDTLNWPLPVLSAALAQCRVFLGHDSGITHLAAAVGCRTIALFGPTEPEVWAPSGPHVRVLRAGNDLTKLGVDDVLRAMESLGQPTQ